MIDLTLWSRTLRDDLLLKNITMPGSHDATIYDGADFNKSGFTKYVVSKARSITQSGSIGDQCRAGARFFDVRLKTDGGVVRGYHQTAGQGGVGASASKILDDVDGFLGARGSEFVILRISHTDRSTGIVDQVLNHPIAKRLYKGNGNLANARIGDLRGKAICIFDVKKFGFKKKTFGSNKDNLIDQAKGIHGFYKYSEGQKITDGLPICGCFEGKMSINDVIADGLKGANDHACHPDDHLFFLYWQQTGGYVESNTKAPGGFDPKSPLKLTGGTHANTPRMLKLLQQQSVLNAVNKPDKAEDKQWKVVAASRGDRMCLPNVISYDFVNATTSEQIVLINDPGVRHYVQRRA